MLLSIDKAKCFIAGVGQCRFPEDGVGQLGKRWSREKGSLGFWVPGLEVMGSRVPSKVLSDITLVLWVQAAGFGNRQGLENNP